MQWNLIRLRKERNLTQEQVAEAIGINISTYQNKENGRSSFKDHEMFFLSRYFGKPIEEIFLESNCTNNAIENKNEGEVIRNE